MNFKSLLSKLGRSWVLPIYPAILITFLYRDILIHHDLISTHDNSNWYAAFNYFLLCLARGELPLWDPYSFAGAPFYLNFNIVGALDPTVIIFAPLVRYFNLSALDAFHYHHMLWNLIFLVGAYSLFLHITKNNLGALFGATAATLIMTPQGLWGQGHTMVIAYAPLIFLILLKLVSQNTSAKSKGYLFISACYLVGLSSNLYLISFLFVFLSMALTYLLATKFIKIIHQTFFIKSRKKLVLPKLNIFIHQIKAPIWQIYTDIGLLKGLIGVIVFTVTMGPFSYSLYKMLPENGEVFSLTRFEKGPHSEVLIHKEKLKITQASSAYQASLFNLMSGFMPGPDSRFFTPYNLGMTEIFFTFGMTPLIIILVFMWGKSKSLKGLFIFLTIIMGFYLFGPNILFEDLLKYFPGVSTIRQFNSFLGFFILAFCGLLAITFSDITDSSNKPAQSNTPLYWLLIVFMFHVVGLFVYLRYAYKNTLLKKFPLEFYDLLQNSIIENGWVLILSYLLVAIFLATANRWLRHGLIFLMVSLSLQQLIEFNTHFKKYLTQPNNTTKDGYVHYDREFEYSPLRVPYVPRHTAFWGYLPALYRIPTAVPPYFNDYMSMTRRTYDYVRFIPAQHQRIVSGIGAKRFGFFDKYTIANNSLQALSLVGRMSDDDLGKVLVLEEDPTEILGEEKLITEVDSESLPLSKFWEKGKDQRMFKFYDKVEYISYEASGKEKKDGFIELTIPGKSSALIWPWDKKHIGFFQLLFGDYQKSTYHRLFDYFPNPGIRFDKAGDKFCISDYKEWAVKHALPGYYNSVYDQYPYFCDMKRTNNKISVSPELQGPFVTNDVIASEQDFMIEGFFVASLDPKKITPEKSPYPRDEPSEVIEFGPNSIKFKIQNSKPGLFYYADSYSNAWKAKLDGVSTHIFKANFNFKAIFIPEGQHVVSMRFHPTFYFYLLWMFILITVPFMGMPFYSLWLDSKGKTLDQKKEE